MRRSLSKAGNSARAFWKVVERLQNVELAVVGSPADLELLPPAFRKKVTISSSDRAEVIAALAKKNIPVENISIGYSRAEKDFETLRKEIQSGTPTGAKSVIAGKNAFGDPIVLLVGFFSQENVYIGVQDDSFVAQLQEQFSLPFRWLSSLDIDRAIRLANRIAQAVQLSA
jgi:hypothetical protein